MNFFISAFLIFLIFQCYFQQVTLRVIFQTHKIHLKEFNENEKI